jgi:hypothetical protein
MLDWLDQMCPRDPEATPNIRLSDDYNITSVVKFPSKFWYFSQVSVKADFHPTITICSLEFAFLQRLIIDIFGLHPILIMDSGICRMCKFLPYIVNQ